VHINQPDDPTMIIEKTGAGAGYTTYIALNPGRHIGIFVAATEGRHSAADIFRESNDLLVYLAGLTPVPGDAMELAAEENRSEMQVRDTTLHKHHKHAARPRLIRQVTRTSVIAAVQ
jgi:D-alanyl-D-alanine-carboxypeptidase/D-alanyl-D-alanine-endopeptidase